MKIVYLVYMYIEYGNGTRELIIDWIFYNEKKARKFLKQLRNTNLTNYKFDISEFKE